MRRRRKNQNVNQIVGIVILIVVILLFFFSLYKIFIKAAEYSVTPEASGTYTREFFKFLSDIFYKRKTDSTVTYTGDEILTEKIEATKIKEEIVQIRALFEEETDIYAESDEVTEAYTNTEAQTLYANVKSEKDYNNLITDRPDLAGKFEIFRNIESIDSLYEFLVEAENEIDSVLSEIEDLYAESSTFEINISGDEIQALFIRADDARRKAERSLYRLGQITGTDFTEPDIIYDEIFI